MPNRPTWPPKYVNVPIEILRDKELPKAAFQFYCELRALAWGEATLRIDFEKLKEETGLSQTRIYEYARALRVHHGLLSCVVRNGAFECSFPESREFPEIRESPNPLTPPQVTSESNTKAAISRKPGKVPENGKSPATGAGTRAIQAEYVRLLGYAPENWAAGEAKAAKAIGECYTVEQLRAAYEHYKADKFWADKRLSLAHLSKQLPEFLRSRNGHGTNGHGANGATLPAQTPEQIEANRALLRANREKAKRGQSPSDTQ